MATPVDEYWMGRALRLAVQGRHASPNPMVGCIIVDKSGRPVGNGYHPQPGMPHAEIYALREAGDRASGATVYVTLEPCAHHGRTPPCATALVAAGVGRLVIAMTDPDSRVSGTGILQLEHANIETKVGVLERDARSLNRAYIHHRLTGMPWVTVKVATTLDGKIATASGDSRWITGPLTRLWVHRQLRDRTDAIMVGVTTVLTDDPLLTTRLTQSSGRNPLRVVLDSKLRTPLSSNVVKLSQCDGKTIIACLEEFAQPRQHEFEERGVTVLSFGADNFNRVDLSAVLSALGTSKDIATVLIEGGAAVIASAIEQGLVNRYIATIAPKLIGGAATPGPIGGNGLASTMNEAVNVRHWQARRSATDLVIDALL